MRVNEGYNKGIRQKKIGPGCGGLDASNKGTGIHSKQMLFGMPCQFVNSIAFLHTRNLILQERETIIIIIMRQNIIQ